MSWVQDHPEWRREYEARPERRAAHRARQWARYQSLSLPEQYALASNRYVRTRLHRLEAVSAALLPMADGCVYCGDEQTGWDHVIPLSRGGIHTEDNLVPCCRPCNSSKGNLTLDQWLARGLIAGWNREKAAPSVRHPGRHRFRLLVNAPHPDTGAPTYVGCEKCRKPRARP